MDSLWQVEGARDPADKHRKQMRLEGHKGRVQTHALTPIDCDAHRQQCTHAPTLHASRPLLPAATMTGMPYCVVSFSAASSTVLSLGPSTAAAFWGGQAVWGAPRLRGIRVR